MREINITFNDQELQYLINALDLVVKTNGLSQAENSLILAKKINQATQVDDEV